MRVSSSWPEWCCRIVRKKRGQMTKAMTLYSALVLLLCGCDVSSYKYDPRCPSSTPTNGSTCDIAMGPLECEYGGDSLGRGTTRADCVESPSDTTFRWALNARPVIANPAQCAATFATAQQATCPASGAIACDYDEGRCACVCTGATLSWQCRARSDVASSVSTVPEPTPLPACAAARPLGGTSCPVEGQTCAYAEYCGSALLSFGPSMGCMNGNWRALPQNVICTAYSCPGVD